MHTPVRLAAQVGQFSQQLMRAVTSTPTISTKKSISTNVPQHSSPVTAEPSVSQTDKFLHYNETEGFYKTSPFEPCMPQNIPLDKYVWRDVNKWQNNVATVCVVTGRQYTFAELRDASAALAVRLQTKFKLGKGDVLGVCLPNLPEYPCILLGAIEAGLSVTTMNPIYTADEISRQLISSKSKFLVCTTHNFPVMKNACIKANKNIPISCVRMRSSDKLPGGAIDFFDLIKTNDVDFSQLQAYDINPDDMVFLPYSSGTTGLPKGVVLTHNNITTNCEQVQKPFQSNSEDTVTGVLPFYHIYGLTVVMLSKLGEGNKLVTLPQFKPDDLLKALTEYRGSILHFVPPIALFMINNPKVNVKTAPALRLVMSGAAPIGVNDVERFKNKFPKTKFLQGYGMTEASPVVILTPPDNTRYASTGFLAGSTEGKIVSFDSGDQKGQGPNLTGELCVRGPQVMPGYLQNEEANRETFYPGRWLRTGDVAYYDDDGYFYITDRMKELIKVKGFQVPPAEIEAILRDHPKITEAAVFGIPHQSSGEVPRALVVLRQGESATEQEIYDYVAERVAVYKKLDGGILFSKEIPKNPTGKILRKALKEQYSS